MDSKKEMMLLSYDHGGYILWGDHFIERLNSAQEWMDKYPKFKIGLDNEAFAYYMYDKENPAIMHRIKELLSKYKGRFAIGATTYGQPLSVFINDESNVRQITYAIRENLKHFKTTPPVYIISEHALHNQIPQLIKQAGYEGAVMRTHFMMYGYNPTFDSSYGYWIGDDGIKIPTIPTYDGEGAEFGTTTLDNWILTRWPQEADQSLEYFFDKFKKYQPLLASRYDDVILRCEELVAHVEDVPHYKWVISEDLMDIYGEPKDLFKPTANDFVVRMPWGYCGNVIFTSIRKTETTIGIAERTNALAVLLGGQTKQAKLEEAWKYLLGTQHHDVVICGILDKAEKYLSHSLDIASKIKEQSMDFVANQFASKGDINVAVFNPHSFKSTQKVEIIVDLPKSKRDLEVRDYKVVFNGEEIPCDVHPLYLGRNHTHYKAKVEFYPTINPLTVNTYELVPIIEARNESLPFSYDGKNGVLESDKYTLVLNENGIKSITDKKTGKRLVDSKTGSLLEGYINDKNCKSKGQWIVSIYSTYAVAKYVGFVSTISFEFELTLSTMTDRIDCKSKLNYNGERIGTIIEPNQDLLSKNTNGFVHEDKLRFILDTTVDADKAHGVRDLPFMTSETSDKYIQGNYWSALTDGGTGIAYFNKGAMGTVNESGRYSIPLAYAEQYVWGGRMLYGEYENKFSIYPFMGNWEDVNLHQKAIEYQFLFAVSNTFGKQEGKIADSVTLFNIDDDNDNLMLSALYPEDSSIIARFYEYRGKDGNLTIQNDAAKLKYEVNIIGEYVGEVEDSKMQFKGREIKSFRLK